MNLKQFRDQYMRHSQPSLLPVYIGLAGLSAWLGVVTVILFDEIGVPTADIAQLQYPILGLMLFFGTWPWVRPLIGMVAQRWLGGEPNP